MAAIDTSSWLALLHQLPTKPPYLRVKVWRRLQAVGAVPIKNAVHVLPRTEVNEKAFRELLAEIEASGGEAILIDARVLAGQTDSGIRGLFDAARDAEYQELVESARRLIDNGPAGNGDMLRLHTRLAEIGALDFFGAHGRQGAEAALAKLHRLRHEHPDVRRDQPSSAEPVDLRGRTWVTRRGVHVDRIACAWLIRRCIDPKAEFRFVDGPRYSPAPNELRFDMANAEFTHEADRCSFETLMLRAKLTGDPGLDAIGEVIHDLDIGDSRFARPETAGIGAMLSGVCASTDDDLERLTLGGEALDQFRTYFSTKTGKR